MGNQVKLTGYVLGSMVGGLFLGRWISRAPTYPRRQGESGQAGRQPLADQKRKHDFLIATGQGGALCPWKWSRMS